LNIGHEPLRNYCCCAFRGIRKDYRKFINTVSGNNIRTAQAFPQKLRDLPYANICTMYPMSSYVIGKIVEVKHNVRKGALVPACPVYFLGKAHMKIAVIEQSAHLVQKTGSCRIRQLKISYIHKKVFFGEIIFLDEIFDLT